MAGVRTTRCTAQAINRKNAENAFPKNVLDVLERKAAPVRRVRSTLGVIGNRQTAQLVTVGKQDNARKEKHVLTKPKLNVPTTRLTGKPARQKTNVRNKQVSPIASMTKPGVVRRIANIVSAPNAQHGKPKVSVKRVVRPKPPAPVAAKPKEQLDKVEAQASKPDLSNFSQEGIANLEISDKTNLKDAKNVVRYMKAIYSYMSQIENLSCFQVVYGIPEAYVKRCKIMTNEMRSTVVDWLVGVHREFMLLSETLYLAVYIFDKYMATALATPKAHLQLVGVTSLLIASKFKEIMCPTTVGDCIYITDYTYTTEQVVEMEAKILARLSFNIGRPLPLQFLRCFSTVADATFETHCTANYFMELQLVRHEMCHVRPSLQAAAAMCLSLFVNLDQDVYDEHKQADQSSSDILKRLWSPTLHYFSAYSFAVVEEAVKQLARVVLKGHSSNLQYLRKKYSSKNLCETINFIEGRLDRIESIRE
ncbi:G2/mitotic-specific cyclin-B2-like [Cloeon dipterum]|uniref:G2/mitotic-specific cyclin-B2-like n=1 Tax=Cloeon dipterum TaxID=197152 RepID=UPI003220903A